MKIQKRNAIVIGTFVAFGLSLLFQNCSKVGFKQADPNASESASLAPAPTSSGLCSDGQPNGSIRWDLVTNQNIEEPAECLYGGNLKSVYQKYQKSVCENGKYVATAETKKGNLIGQTGACNCTGGVTNGMTIWQLVPNQTLTDSKACPANGTLSLVYEKEQQYICANGTLSATMNFQKGKLLRQDGVCACADGSLPGSSTYNVVPNANITEPGVCQYGGNLQSIFEKLQKYVCQNSQSVAQNDFMKGKLLQTTGACSCEGGVINGGSLFKPVTGETISEPVTCKYDGNLMNVYEKQEKLLCTNGTYGTTGQFQKGIFLKQTGACNPPPVISVTIPVSVSTSEKPLDMIWIIDNSSSMTEEAANVRANLGSFLKSLDVGADMKFLLISAKGTTGTTAAVPAGLDPARFVQVNRGITSSSAPKALNDVLDEYKASGKPFFRSFSKKIIVFVTDAESRLSANEVVNNLAAHGATTPDLTINGFVGVGGSASACTSIVGTEYKNMASLTKGKIFNICEVDWTQYFINLKTDILTNVARNFKIDKTPIAKIVKVELDGAILDASLYSYLNGVITVKEGVKLLDTSVLKVYFTQE